MSTFAADPAPRPVSALVTVGEEIAAAWYNETVPHGHALDLDYDLSAPGDVEAVEKAIREAIEAPTAEQRAEAFRVARDAYRSACVEMTADDKEAAAEALGKTVEDLNDDLSVEEVAADDKADDDAGRTSGWIW